MKGIVLVFCALAIPVFAQTQVVTTVTALHGPVGCSGRSSPYLGDPFCSVPNLARLGAWAPFTRPSLSYVDSNFGGRVTTLAPWGNASPYLFHVYSYPSPWSRNKKYLLALDPEGALYLLDGHTGAVQSSRIPYRSCGPQWVPWDAYSDDIYYYCSGTQLYKYDISHQASTMLYDFGPNNAFTSLATGGNDEVTPNNLTAVYDPSTQQVCAIDLTAVKVYCASWNTSQVTQDGTLPVSNPDYVEVTKGADSVTGKQYVMLVASPANVIWSIDRASQILHFELRGPQFDDALANQNGKYMASYAGPDHGAAYQGSDGKQYWISPADFFLNGQWTRALFAFPFGAGAGMGTLTTNGGGAQLLFVIGVGAPTVDMHIGCANNSSPPACVISTTYESPSPAPTAAPSTQVPNYEEIIVLKDLTSAVRIASTYSICFDSGSGYCGGTDYYDQSRAAISPDGSAVVFDSNFGVSTHWFLNVVETTPERPRPVPGIQQHERRNHHGQAGHAVSAAGMPGS